MSTPNVGLVELSRWYVSGAKEATQGVSAALTKTFLAAECSIEHGAKDQKRPGVTGYQNQIDIVRTGLMSSGKIVDNLYPDIVNWVMRMVFGGAPTNASVGPSNTAYSHTFNALTMPVSTFTLLKQHGKVATGPATERMTGIAVTAVTIKSQDGLLSIEATCEGLGSGYTTGVADPANTVLPLVTVDQTPLIGAQTQLTIDSTPITLGLFSPNWSVTINTGYGVMPTAGSTDGSATRIGKKGTRSVTANFEIYVIDKTWFDDFKNATFHDVLVQAIGPTIDAPNSITSLVQLEMKRCRATNKIAADIKQGVGDLKVPLQFEAVIDAGVPTTYASGTGYDVVVTTQDLVAAP